MCSKPVLYEDKMRLHTKHAMTAVMSHKLKISGL